MENRKHNDLPGEHRRRQRWEGAIILATALGDEALFYGRQLAAEAAEGGLLERRRQRALQELVEDKRQKLNLGRVEIFSNGRDLLVSAAQADMPARGRSSTNTTLLERVLRNEEVREVRPT